MMIHIHHSNPVIFIIPPVQQFQRAVLKDGAYGLLQCLSDPEMNGNHTVDSFVESGSVDLASLESIARDMLMISRINTLLLILVTQYAQETHVCQDSVSKIEMFIPRDCVTAVPLHLRDPLCSHLRCLLGYMHLCFIRNQEFFYHTL
jgi:hypothetical protein